MAGNTTENQEDTSRLIGQIRSLYNAHNAGNDAGSGAKEIERLDPEKEEELKGRASDRKLKKYYARWFIRILIGQLIVMNAVMAGFGLGWLKLEESVLNLYMTGTMLEIFGVVLVITKYLFKRT